MLLAWRAVAARLIGILLLAQAAIAQPQPPTNAPHPPDRFVTVNAVRLQYIDWGGRGDVLLFLPGLGASAHQFDSFAPKFIDQFHVLGLTRRGQGLSDKPPSGYDTVTLAEDIKGFLDVMRIRRVMLIAHSLGGVEMTRFAAAHPDRVTKLVYLDAANDAPERHQLMADAGIRYPPYHNDAERQLDTQQSHLDFTNVKAPALAFFVIFDPGYGAQPDAVLCPGCTADVANDIKRFWRLMEEKHFWTEQADRFRKEMKHGRVITLHGTNHFFYQDPTRVDDVVREIRTFLMAN